MPPLSLLIPGEYWDSQVYAGRLYLFERDGSLRTIDWDRLISHWPLPPALRLALIAGYLRSDFLYGPELLAFFQDPEIRRLVTQKFASLGTAALELPLQILERHTLGRQVSPFPFPHSDSEIYDSRLYVAGPSGLSRARCRGKTKNAVSTRVDKLLAMPVLSISTAFGTIAAATGEEGLFELPVDSITPSTYLEPGCRTPLPCERCNWMFSSIFGSSANSDSFFLEYSYPSSRPPRYAQQLRWETDIETRVLQGVTRAREIFGHGGYAWGVRDKICSASNGTVDVVRYLPWAENKLEHIGGVAVSNGGGEIVAASTAAFGAIIEYAGSIAVHQSDGATFMWEGEPVSWRVFPRSKHYENHLHIIHEDHLEILSFNHDYLLDQEKKVMGTTVPIPRKKSAAPLLALMQATVE